MSIRYLLPALLVLLFSSDALHADDKKKERKPPLDPVVQAQLTQMFDRLDRDKDGFIDKAELAKAFRGPNARPAPDLRPPEDDAKKTAKNNVNPALYPDGLFLLAYDDDEDDKISFVEFEDAGAEHSKQAKQTAEQIRKAQEQALKDLVSRSRPARLTRRMAGRSYFAELAKQFGR